MLKCKMAAACVIQEDSTGEAQVQLTNNLEDASVVVTTQGENPTQSTDSIQISTIQILQPGDQTLTLVSPQNDQNVPSITKSVSDSSHGQQNSSSPAEPKPHVKVEMAIQVNDYDIERRSGRLPARKRVVPFKFRDYKNPDAVDEDNSSDSDFNPDQSVMSVKRKVVTAGRGKRGRPRKYPHLYTTNPQLTEVQLVEINPELIQVAVEDRQNAGTAIQPSGDQAASQGETTNHNVTVEGSDTARPSHGGDLRKTDVMVPVINTFQAGRGRGRPPQDSKCPHCDKIFSSKGNMKVHLLIHTGEKPFLCDFQNCNKAFRSNETLRRHRLSHMGIKSFECNFCSNKFASSVSLQEHMCRHTDSRPHQCNICLKNFRQISCLRRHLVTHSSELPFSCQVCGKKFSQMIYLRSHMKTHTGERPYKCDKCGKAFAHQSDVTRHKIIHTGDRPYECEVCHSRFSDPSSRRRHQREHVGVKPYTCQLCSDSFKRAGQLKAHLSRKHTNQKDDVHVIRQDNGSIEFIFKDGSNPLAKDLDKGERNVDQSSLSKQKKIVKLIKDLNSSMVQHVQINLPPRDYSTSDDIGQGQNEASAEDLRAVQTVYLETMSEQQDSIQNNSEIAEAVIHDLVNTNSEVQEVTDIHNIVTQKEDENGEQTVIAIAEVQDLMQAAGENGEVPVEYLQIIEELAPDSLAQQIVEVHYQQSEDANSEAASSEKNDTNGTVAIEQVAEEMHTDIANQVVEQEITCIQEETSSIEHSSPPSHSTTANPDFVTNPDFSSQQYYNWLSSFTELCKVVPMPLDVSLFHKISQVHKTLSDVMATPSGVVADKENFKILMNISKELNTIINEHLLYVMQNLHGEK